jgi:hypothetical protein
MTIARLRVRLFFLKVWFTVSIAYTAARLHQASGIATWELFKASVRGIWAIK